MYQKLSVYYATHDCAFRPLRLRILQLQVIGYVAAKAVRVIDARTGLSTSVHQYTVCRFRQVRESCGSDTWHGVSACKMCISSLKAAQKPREGHMAAFQHDDWLIGLRHSQLLHV